MRPNLMRPTLMLAGLLIPAGFASGQPAELFFAPHSGDVLEASAVRTFRGTIPEKATETIQIAAPTFNVTYLDVAADNDIGFDDPTVGADRRATMNAVVAYVAGVITDNGNCDIEVQISQTDGSGFLAAAGTFFPAVAGFHPGRAFQHLTTGIDASPANPDIVVTVDFGYNWNSDTGPVSAGEFDLYSVLLHEITHGLGISSFSDANGDSRSGVPNLYTAYDDLLHRASDGQKAWDALGSFQLSSADLIAGDNSVDFRGATAAAQYTGGANPFVDTLNPFTNGSSMSHFQTTNTPAGTVMVRAITTNAERRTYTFFEARALQDLGYSIDAAALPVDIDLFLVE